MSFVLANRVKETSLSTGSGDITLLGAMAGYQSFSDVLTPGDTTYYTIVNLDAWEVGLGTYSANSLSRNEVLSSSNNNSKINLSGQSFVFICYPSERSVYKNSNNQIVVTSSGIRFNDGTIQLTASSGVGGGNVYYAGTGLILSGSTFHESGNVIRSGSNISLLNNDIGYLISHPSISGIGNIDNLPRTYVRNILTDTNGHVTGISVGTETGLPYFAGNGLILTGFGIHEDPSGFVFSVDETVIQSGDNISFLNNDIGFLTAHPNINAALSVDNTNSGQYRYYIQDVLLDSYGHVTGLSTGVESIIQLSYEQGTGIHIEGNVIHVADEVIMSGNNISFLNNDAGYLTAHPSILSASTSNNSGRTYIQDIFLDSNGHVTGIATATETVVDTNTTYSAGSGLSLNGTTFNVSGIYLTSHPTISGISSNNSGRTYIQSILVDTNGHITGVTTATETVTDTNTTYSAGTGLLLNGTIFSLSGNVLRSGNSVSFLNNDVGYLTSHPTILGVSSSNSGRVYIQSILTDTNGHVTGISTATESGSSSYTAGTGLLLTGNSFSTFGTGVFSSILLSQGIPNSTTNALYNNSGVLFFNGSGVGSGGQSYTATSGIRIVSNTITATGSLPSLSNWSWSSGIEIPAFSGQNALSIQRIGNSSGNLLSLGDSGYIEQRNLKPGTDANSYRFVVSSSIALNVGSPTYKEFGGELPIDSTGIWKIKWFWNCKSTLSITTTPRLVITSGCVSGVTGDVVGLSLGNGTPAVLSLAFSGPSGLLTGTGRAGTTANVSSEVTITCGGTGLIIPGLTTNNATNGGTLTSGYLEASKIA